MPFLPLFTGIRHLAHVLTVPPTKACLLCITPTGLNLYIQAMPVGTYWVQSPGFPKIVYCAGSFSKCRSKAHQPVDLKACCFPACIYISVYQLTFVGAGGCRQANLALTAVQAALSWWEHHLQSDWPWQLKDVAVHGCLISTHHSIEAVLEDGEGVRILSRSLWDINLEIDKITSPHCQKYPQRKK